MSVTKKTKGEINFVGKSQVGIQLAVEYGYRACERGMSLEAALASAMSAVESTGIKGEVLSMDEAEHLEHGEMADRYARESQS